MDFCEFLVHNLNLCAYVLTSVILQESWEDEEEEKKDEEKTELSAPAPTKPKKRIQDKIAEKEVSKKKNTTYVTNSWTLATQGHWIVEIFVIGRMFWLFDVTVITVIVELIIYRVPYNFQLCHKMLACMISKLRLDKAY